ncbi:hypothetical protein B0O99DRAFT_274549 [Bisporella sp. PMI_857]|nr:hypothetical protein B0O99DRAFT_274549 [Bisporella sp. PMI_857]
MHMQTHLQTLQEDAIPFRDALGLSITAFVLAVTRLCGCFEKGRKWYSFSKGNLSNLHIWTCLLSFAGSGGLLVFSGSKIYQKYQSVYLGLILVNFILLGLYEIEYIRKFSVINKKLEKSCIWALGCIGLLVIAGFIMCFIYAIPAWMWESVLFGSGGISYILVLFGYYCLWQSSKVPAVQRALMALCIPIPFIFISAAFIRANRLVLVAWIFCNVSSVCTLRFQLIPFTRRGISTVAPNSLVLAKYDCIDTALSQQREDDWDIKKKNDASAFVSVVMPLDPASPPAKHR